MNQQIENQLIDSIEKIFFSLLAITFNLDNISLSSDATEISMNESNFFSPVLTNLSVPFVDASNLTS